MPTSKAGTRARRADGFTYLAMLAALVVVGIAAQIAVPVYSRAARADKEAELLFRGQAYRAAIRSYYEAGAPVKSFPRDLRDLVNDPRFPRKHHLRTLYADPFGREWMLLRAADGGISGVASGSREAPLKRANFPLGFEHFEPAAAYSDWVFEYRPNPAIHAPR